MTKNTALRGAAWLATLIVANATQFGELFQNTAELIITKVHPHDHNLELHGWLLVFVFLTFVATYMGNVFVGIWGNEQAIQPAPPPPHTAAVSALMAQDDRDRTAKGLTDNPMSWR